MNPGEALARMRDTQDAFDSVAADYDGARGNNAAIQRMRAEMWRWLDATFAPASRLIDIGCGTGLDAVRMAHRGHTVTAVDWSAGMVERTRHRAAAAGLDSQVRALHVGAQELQRLDGDAQYDGAYSNLGPLNCVPDLESVSRECARLVKPGGALVFTVIGRICPWEIAHYTIRGRWARIAVRFTRGMTAVGMNRHTIWTRYFTPRQFHLAFENHFELAHHRSVCLFVPPPYLAWPASPRSRWHERLWRLDRRVGGWPLLRAMGDHFLVILRRR